MDISVVILHYNDLAMTQAYIETLRQQDWAGMAHHFLIVDNASPDGSGKLLEQSYAQADDTTVLLSEKNLGFARGNNLGIQYGAAHFHSDLYVVSNNDILIEDIHLMQRLADVYAKTHFDLFGPDVFSTRKQIHQSPLRQRYLDEEALRQQMKRIDGKLWKLKIIDRINVYDFISQVKKWMGKSHQNVPGYQEAQEGVVLHGAFFVLAKSYLKAYPDGLYPGTFLYLEEDLLNYRAHLQNMKILYDPSLSVLHLDGASTLKSRGSRCKKFIFELEETKRSCQKALDYMEQMKNSGSEQIF